MEEKNRQNSSAARRFLTLSILSITSQPFPGLDKIIGDMPRKNEAICALLKTTAVKNAKENAVSPA
jgi:hypothetical protein